VLVEGWRGIFAFDIMGLSWLTNPLLLGAWLSFFFLRNPWPAVLAVGALATAATSFLFATTSEEAELFEGFGPGFYLWLVAVLLQATAAAAVTFKLREAPSA
jgi:protein-S-isoprenylcysteine O-methyltransferase Ste14